MPLLHVSRISRFAIVILPARLRNLGAWREAKAAVDRLLLVSPGYSINKARQTFPWRNQDEFDRYLDGLRAAGLPEE